MSALYFSEDPSFHGTGHIPLILAATVAAVIAKMYGYSWAQLEEGISNAISMSLPAILILFVIGMLMGTWIASGVVPAMIVLGLRIINPAYFLPTTCIVCSVVSLTSGSSWSTAGTIGLALMGIGTAMGIHPGMTAGAVISGAYFGDKLSPMSDTTNLAPAMSGANLFEHIHHMVRTTGVAWILAMIGYTTLGIWIASASTESAVLEIHHLMTQTFSLGIWQWLPPTMVLGLVLTRQPALPSLLLGAILGAVVAITTQDTSVSTVVEAALHGYQAHTGHEALDKLLNRGGMMAMAETVALVACAMAFGGIMEKSGMLQALAQKILTWAHSNGSLIITAVLTSIGMNIVAADQYVAIVVPGRMYAPMFQSRGLHPKNLSRALEDGGTITSPLVPWNTCGVFMSATLMVATGTYLPFAFLNWINPLVAIFYAALGWNIVLKTKDDS